VLTTIILGFGALAVLFLLSLRRSTGIQQYTSLLIDASLKDKGSAASALQRWEAKPDTTILAQWKDGSTEEASQHPHVYPMDHAQYRYYVLSLPDMHIDDVASLLEIEYVGPVGEITSYHLFRTAALAHPFYYSVKPSDSLLTRISINNTTTDNYVSIKKRSLTKRDISAVSENDPVIKRYNELNDATNHKTRINRRSISVIQSIDHISVQLPYKRFKRGIIPVTHDVKQQDAIIEALGIHDPGYHNQWHLYNYQQPNNDINITGVWQQGITGKNVVIALVDDGIDFTSEDIKDNFVSMHDICMTNY
jgi:kexin